MTKKHVVFVLNDYLPRPSANGVCISRLIQVLEDEYDISVVCERNDREQADWELLGQQQIYRTVDWKRRWRQSRQPVKVKIAQLINFAQLLLVPVTISHSLVRAYLHRLREVADPIDVLVPTCYSFESIVAAMQYKVAYPNVVLVPYLFDKFSESTMLHRLYVNKLFKYYNNVALEREMFTQSAHVFASHDWEKHIRRHHEQFLDKITFTSLPSIAKVEDTGAMEFSSGKRHLSYTGTLSRKNRPPNFLLHVMGQVFQQLDDVVLHFYQMGDCDAVLNDYSHRYPGKILNHGSVDIASAHSAIAQSQVLVSIGNRDISQTPSKIYEYISSGKPLIHLYTNPEDPVVSILASYPYALCVPQSMLSVNEVVMLICDFLERSDQYSALSFEQIEEQFVNASPRIIAKKVHLVFQQKLLL